MPGFFFAYQLPFAAYISQHDKLLAAIARDEDRMLALGKMVSKLYEDRMISALAEYSMLADNQYPTVAFEKAQMKELNTVAWQQVPAVEQPACIAHEVGYILPFGEHNAIDPLSITLMLTDEDRADPRIEISVDEMLEEYVW